ncbi:MAG: DUF983 domain-containing protein [Cytophagales bacterium]|nr:DUF983 domain-containing protein [Cytophagales bacterium]
MHCLVFQSFQKLNSHCSRCQVSLFPNPGFYFGALFVSYAFNVALMVAISILLYFTINPADWVYGVSLVAVSDRFYPCQFSLL